jgi:outer membrane receptor protein involved in Fe transport
MRTLTQLLAVAAVVASVGISSPARAQATTAASDKSTATQNAKRAGSPDAEMIELSPFVVSTEKDTGYIAADTLTAGLLNTSLIMTPGNIEVMTRDLLNDLGITNSDQASAWLTNSRPLELGATEGNSMNPGSLAQSDSGTNVSLRGIAGTTNPSTRNYFTSASTPKEYNVERVESSRGPNAILYGEGGPGGGVNYITKRAKSRNFGTLRLRGDDNGSKSVALDLNRRVTGDLDVRYNVNLLHQRYFIDRTDFKEVDHALNAIYRPYKGTSITVDADYTRNTRPGLIMTYGEQYAKWDHVPVTSKVIAPGTPQNPTLNLANTLTARGLATWTGAKNLIWTDGIGMLDLTGYVHSVGYGLPQPTEYTYGDAYFPSLTPNVAGISTLPPLPRRFNANPKDIDVNDRAKDFQVAIDHVFKNGISVQLAGQYSKLTTRGGNYYFTTIYLDVLQVLPDGKTNPNYNKPYANSYVGRTIDYERDSRAVRAVMAYPLKLGESTTNFSAFVTHQQKNDTTIYTDLHVKDPTSTLPITDAASLIHVNRYFDNLSAELPDFRSLYSTVDVPVADGRNRQKLQAVEVAASGSYLRDTLSIIAGFRRDSSGLSAANGLMRDPVTGAYTTYTTDDRKAYNNTTVFGLVYFPIKYVGVFANHGEGFTVQTNTNLRLDGTFGKANIVPAKDQSAGLRFNLSGRGDIKIIGSIGYYKAEQAHIVTAVGASAVNVLFRDQGIFEGKDYSSSYIRTLSSDQFTTAAANSVSSSRSLVGTGWEGSLTANVGNSLRLTINGALPKTKQSDYAADYVAYVTPRLPAWQALANNAANPNRAADLTAYNQILSFITGFAEGREQNLSYKYRYNVFGVYTFNQKPIRGLRVGGGANFFGRSLIGNEVGQSYNYVYAKPYHLVTGQIGYPFKLGKYRMDAQLNITNLLGYDEPIYNGLFVQAVGTQSINIPYGKKDVWPRAVNATVTLQF